MEVISFLASILVSVQHDWLDYAAAVAGVIGGVAAVAALIFALLSARAADRSARSADESARLVGEQVKIMREEADVARAERSRRAAPEAELRDPTVIERDGNGDGPATVVTLTIAVTNEAGTRSADDLAVNCWVPDSIQLRSCLDATGAETQSSNINADPTRRLGDHVGGRFFWEEHISVKTGTTQKRFLRLERPPAGRHCIELVLRHDDLPAGVSRSRWDLLIPESAGQPLLAHVSPPTEPNES